MKTFLLIYLIVSLVVAIWPTISYCRDQWRFGQAKGIGGRIWEVLVTYIKFVIGWPVMLFLYIRYLTIMK